MATLYDCDRCRKQIPADDETRVEWSLVSIAKITHPLAPFQKMDLCPACTGGLRTFFQQPGTNEA